MSEYVHVPVSLWRIQDKIAISALESLVAARKLPADFEFRALALDDVRDWESGDPNYVTERQKIVLQDVRAALGLGEPSGHQYLTQELPDCVSVPTSDTKSLTEILREVAVDYHQLGTLLKIAYREGVEEQYGYQAWLAYINYLDPEKYEKLVKIKEPGPQEGSFSKMYNFKSNLRDVVIRDSALMPIYEDPKLVPRQGPIKRGLLRILLLDNHPELIKEV